MGGNVFKGRTQSIKRENIEPTVELYFQELARVFPHKKDIFNKKHFKYVGSVGKKAVSGDIDFAIDISSFVDKSFSEKSIQKWGLNYEEVIKQFTAYKKRAKTATDTELMTRALLKGIVTQINTKADNIYCDEKKIGTGGIFGLFPQYNENGDKLDYGIQIDWMLGDLDLLEFSYYSEPYPEGSNVKGLHKTQLMLSMFNFYGYSFAHAKGLTDIKTGEKLATKPKDMIPYLEKAMGLKLSKRTMSNYYRLVKTLDEIPKEDRDSILNIFFKIMSSTRADIPTDIQDDWRRLNKIHNYQTKFLPEDSLLLENLTENSNKAVIIKDNFKFKDLVEGLIRNRSSEGKDMSREQDWLNRNHKMTELIQNNLGSHHLSLYKIYNQFFLVSEDLEYIGSIECKYDLLQKKILRVTNSYKNKTKLNKSLYEYIFGTLFGNKIIKEVHSDKDLDISAFKLYEKLHKNIYTNTELSSKKEFNKDNFEEDGVYIIVKENKNHYSYHFDKIKMRLTESTRLPDGTFLSRNQEVRDYQSYNPFLDELLFGSEPYVEKDK